MKKAFLEGLELINQYLSTFNQGLYGQNKWKEDTNKHDFHTFVSKQPQKEEVQTK